MRIVVEAVFERGVLKPSTPLPLLEHESVELTIRTRTQYVPATYGLVHWTGEVATLEQVAMDAEFGVQERA